MYKRQALHASSGLPFSAFEALQRCLVQSLRGRQTPFFPAMRSGDSIGVREAAELLDIDGSLLEALAAASGHRVAIEHRDGAVHIRAPPESDRRR